VRVMLAVLLIVVSSIASAQPARSPSEGAGTATITRPVLGVVRASRPVLPNVERFDAEAYRTQTNLLSARASSVGVDGLAMALRAYLMAEYDLETVLDRSWSSLPLTRVINLMIDEPLALAMLQLQIELRRLLGPQAHTNVTDLSASPGCAGDLIAQRLVYRYGLAVTQGVFSADALKAIGQALQSIAVQIACISEAQLAQLEPAVAVGFEEVSDKMTLHGMQALIPGFARLVAPIQVLILDARKHRGAKSAAWRWFVAYGPLIKQDVGRSGWGSGNLYLWDRHTGKLDAIPSCSGSETGPSCVNVGVFLDSVADPRALGLGTCSLAAMVSREPAALPEIPLASGINPTQPAQRYSCPVRACSSRLHPVCGGTGLRDITGGCAPTGNANPAMLGRGIPAAPSTTAQLKTLWPTLTDGDISAINTLCRDAGNDSQGLVSEPQQCADAATSNPFDVYAACMAAVAGGGEPPEVSDSYAGVPTGNQCKLSEGSSDTPPQPPPPEEKPEQEKSFVEKVVDTFVKVALAVADIFKPSEAPTEPGPGVGTAGGVIIHTAAELVTPEGAAAEGAAMVALLRKGLMDAWSAGRITDQQFTDNYGKLSKPGGPAEVRDFLKQHGSLDCLDPGACSDSCTGLGKQLQASNACLHGLLGALAKAIELPSRGNIPHTRPLGPVIYPSPDAPVPATDADFCVVGSGDLPHQNIACGVELCINSGYSGIGSRDGCACDEGSSTSLNYRPVVNRCLQEIRCPDGQLPTETCSCTAADAQPSRPVPVPLPTLNPAGSGRGPFR
jgi:hypothetical protein